jgi:hypothetical protein
MGSLEEVMKMRLLAAIAAMGAGLSACVYDPYAADGYYWYQPSYRDEGPNYYQYYSSPTPVRPAYRGGWSYREPQVVERHGNDHGRHWSGRRHDDDDRGYRHGRHVADR